MTLYEYSKSASGICFMTDADGRIIRRGSRERPSSVRAMKSISPYSAHGIGNMADGECKAVSVNGVGGATEAFVIRDGEYAFWFITRGTRGMLLPRSPSERYAAVRSFAKAVYAACSGAEAGTLFTEAMSEAVKRLYPKGMALPDMLKVIGLCARILFGDDLLTLPDLIPKDALIAELEDNLYAVGKLLLTICRSGERAVTVLEDDMLVFMCGGERISQVVYRVSEPMTMYTVRPYIFDNACASAAVVGASALELSAEVRDCLRRYDAGVTERRYEENVTR